MGRGANVKTKVGPLVDEQEAVIAELQLRMAWLGLKFPCLAPLMYSFKSILAPWPQAEQQTIQTF